MSDCNRMNLTPDVARMGAAHILIRGPLFYQSNIVSRFLSTHLFCFIPLILRPTRAVGNDKQYLSNKIRTLYIPVVDGITFENREIGRIGVKGRTVLKVASLKFFVR